MARCHEFVLKIVNVLWIYILLISQCESKKTETFYMNGPSCGETVTIDGATVYSHYDYKNNKLYENNIECRLTFKARNSNLRIMINILELDIPDIYYNDLCNDALYVYDASSILGKTLKKAGRNNGLCGKTIPNDFLESTGEYLTVYFRTNNGGLPGEGFKFVVTAFSEIKLGEVCNEGDFRCNNNRCINKQLMCDQVDHCGDYSDESTLTGAKCTEKGPGYDGGSTNSTIADGDILTKFLSLGVTASIAISIGSIILVTVIIVCVVCCCCRKCRKDSIPDNVTTSATSVSASGPYKPVNQQKTNAANNQFNEGPNGQQQQQQQQPYNIPNGQQFNNRPNGQQYPNDHPMTAYSGSNGPPSIYSSNTSGVTGQQSGHGINYTPATHYTQHGYQPMHQAPVGGPGPPTGPFTQYNPRESFSQTGSGCSSSQAPPSYHRSYTPTSSRSGKSGRSAETGGTGSVSYTKTEPEKITFPVQV